MADVRGPAGGPVAQSGFLAHLGLPGAVSLLLYGAAILWVPGGSYVDPPLRFALFSFGFVACLLAALVALRSFLRNGEAGVLRIGMGLLLAGLFELASGISTPGLPVDPLGPSVEKALIYRVGAGVAGPLWLLWGFRSPCSTLPGKFRRRALLREGALAAMVVSGAVLAAQFHLHGHLHHLYEEGRGPTPLVSLVVYAASLLFLLAAIQSHRVHRLTGDHLFGLMASALAVRGMADLGPAIGGPLWGPVGWASRGLQAGSNVLLLAAFLHHATLERRPMNLCPAPENHREGDPCQDLKPGRVYLVPEAHPRESLRLFRDMVTHGTPGLYISPRAPERVREETGLEKTPLLWLTERRIPGREDAIPASDLALLVHTIEQFTRQVKRGCVFLEGLEYLVSVNGFPAVLRTVDALRDVVSTSDERLLLPLDPRTLEARDYARLQRFLEVLKPPEEEHGG
ncbi:MAG: DUF835 domain-containing protein [Euryarchaeota archaeon]|nr:DUF835 domain-containing protein [Euryarchaeota archaeon]